MTSKILLNHHSIKTPRNTTPTKQALKNGPKLLSKKTGKTFKLLMSITVAIRNSKNPNEEKTFMSI